MPKKIEVYALLWGLEDKKGKVRLFFSNDDFIDYSVETAEEFTAIATILGDSTDTFYDSDKKTLKTGMELPGPDL